MATVTRTPPKRSTTAPDLLRFTTAGSVDDGKSTLIGRLLHDSRSVHLDRLEKVRGASRRLGEKDVNLALLTDGLRAEREQKITIDVAYRYFQTDRRKFIIADTPGHVQYTRNMVTGASTADLAVILVDARRGLVTQSRRHAFIVSLLGISHVIVAVNKMDLVDWSEDVFERIRADFRELAKKLTIDGVDFVPLSALHGDNVVERSARMPWYDGRPLLGRLESVNPTGRFNAIDFRFPVQTVIRPDQEFRGFAGTIASGRIRPGDEVVTLPSGLATRIESIVTRDGDLEQAGPGDAVVLTTEHELDIARGDMIVRRRNVPTVTDRIEAYLCWMDETPLDSERRYVLRHTTRSVRATVERLEYEIDVDTLGRREASTLRMNGIGRAELALSDPIFMDSYRVNHPTGSFVLIDPATHATVAAGMIRGEAGALERAGIGRSDRGSRNGRPVSPDVTWEPVNIPREEREARTGHPACVIWFTGMSGAGKSSIGRAVERVLFDRGCRTTLLDGDQVRHGLCGDLGFSADDRSENIRRVGETAKLFFDQGTIVLCCFVSPYREDRDRVRALLPEGRFIEVHVHAPLETLRERDPKGLYRREARGDISDLPGSRGVFETPSGAELRIDTSRMTVEEAADEVLHRLSRFGIEPPGPPER